MILLTASIISISQCMISRFTFTNSCLVGNNTLCIQTTGQAVTSHLLAFSILTVLCGGTIRITGTWTHIIFTCLSTATFWVLSTINWKGIRWKFWEILHFFSTVVLICLLWNFFHLPHPASGVVTATYPESHWQFAALLAMTQFAFEPQVKLSHLTSWHLPFLHDSVVPQSKFWLHVQLLFVHVWPFAQWVSSVHPTENYRYESKYCSMGVCEL